MSYRVIEVIDHETVSIEIAGVVYAAQRQESGFWSLQSANDPCRWSGLPTPDDLHAVLNEAVTPCDYCDGTGENEVEEIAASFINGNIAWVREQIKENPPLAVSVAAWILENSPSSFGPFARIYGVQS